MPVVVSFGLFLGRRWASPCVMRRGFKMNKLTMPSGWELRRMQGNADLLADSGARVQFRRGQIVMPWCCPKAIPVIDLRRAPATGVGNAEFVSLDRVSSAFISARSGRGPVPAAAAERSRAVEASGSISSIDTIVPIAKPCARYEARSGEFSADLRRTLLHRRLRRRAARGPESGPLWVAS